MPRVVWPRVIVGLSICLRLLLCSAVSFKSPNKRWKELRVVPFTVLKINSVAMFHNGCLCCGEAYSRKIYHRVIFVYAVHWPFFHWHYGVHITSVLSSELFVNISDQSLILLYNNSSFCHLLSWRSFLFLPESLTTRVKLVSIAIVQTSVWHWHLSVFRDHVF